MALSTPLPIPSRTVIGSMNGTIRYGPGVTPHTASVCPKSSRLFSIPQYFAASNRPPRPAGGRRLGDPALGGGTVSAIADDRDDRSLGRFVHPLARRARLLVGTGPGGAGYGRRGDGQQRRLGLDGARQTAAPAERHHRD